jgi:hypothetical protein
MTQARWEVQPRHGYLHISAYSQGHHQCFRRSRGRCGAPPDNANWASATHSQEFSWYMEVALPAGDTQNVFSALPDVQFFPVYNLVYVGLDCGNTSCSMSLSFIGRYPTHRFTGLRSSEFEWYVSLPPMPMWTESDGPIT